MRADRGVQRRPRLEVIALSLLSIAASLHRLSGTPTAHGDERTIDTLDRRITALAGSINELRARVGALTYLVEPAIGRDLDALDTLDPPESEAERVERERREANG